MMIDGSWCCGQFSTSLWRKVRCGKTDEGYVTELDYSNEMFVRL